jgi:hypothetical protein
MKANKLTKLCTKLIALRIYTWFDAIKCGILWEYNKVCSTYC